RRAAGARRHAQAGPARLAGQRARAVQRDRADDRADAIGRHRAAARAARARAGPRAAVDAGARARRAEPVGDGRRVRAGGDRARATPLWSRLPRPRQLLDGCGRALRRAVPAMIGLVAVGAVAGGGYGAYHFVTHSPRFAITDIEVRGTHVLAPDAIRARLGFTA